MLSWIRKSEKETPYFLLLKFLYPFAYCNKDLAKFVLMLRKGLICYENIDREKS